MISTIWGPAVKVAAKSRYQLDSVNTKSIRRPSGRIALVRKAVDQKYRQHGERGALSMVASGVVELRSCPDSIYKVLPTPIERDWILDGLHACI